MFISRVGLWPLGKRKWILFRGIKNRAEVKWNRKYFNKIISNMYRVPFEVFEENLWRKNLRISWVPSFEPLAFFFGTSGKESVLKKVSSLSFQNFVSLSSIIEKLQFNNVSFSWAHFEMSIQNASVLLRCTNCRFFMSAAQTSSDVRIVQQQSWLLVGCIRLIKSDLEIL